VATDYDVTRLPKGVIDELAASLDPESRRVILLQGTEPPFCGTLLDDEKSGVYVCRLCALPLFRSTAKFHSGTGWPSFYEGYAEGHIEELVDGSHGMVRTEIRCQRCGGHLGHVFPDGPPPTGLRYCLNSVSLEFVESGQAFPQKLACDRAMGARTA
jgi:peptide-methionine (R)-S-oxide reductase